MLLNIIAVVIVILGGVLLFGDDDVQVLATEIALGVFSGCAVLFVLWRALLLIVSL